MKKSEQLVTYNIQAAIETIGLVGFAYCVVNALDELPKLNTKEYNALKSTVSDFALEAVAVEAGNYHK